jgi:hypothetical protein
MAVRGDDVLSCVVLVYDETEMAVLIGEKKLTS